MLAATSCGHNAQLHNNAFDSTSPPSLEPAHEAWHAAWHSFGFEASSVTHVLLCVRGAAAPPIGRELESPWRLIGQVGAVRTAESMKPKS